MKNLNTLPASNEDQHFDAWEAEFNSTDSSPEGNLDLWESEFAVTNETIASKEDAIEAARARLESPAENVLEAASRIDNARAEGQRLAEQAGEILSPTKDILVSTGRAIGRGAVEAGFVAAGAVSLGTSKLMELGKSKLKSAKTRYAAHQKARQTKKMDKIHTEALTMHDEFRQNQYDKGFDRAATELYDNTEIGDTDRFNAIPEGLDSDQIRGWKDARTNLIDSVHAEALEDNKIYNYDKGYSDASTQLRKTEAGDADTFSSVPENLNDDQLEGWQDARQDFINDAHAEALAENEVFEAKVIAEKARAAKERKEARRQARIDLVNAMGHSATEKINKGLEWSKGTRVAKFGRALARFTRNAKAYAKGVHAAGMESVRNANIATVEQNKPPVE